MSRKPFWSPEADHGAPRPPPLLHVRTGLGLACEEGRQTDWPGSRRDAEWSCVRGAGGEAVADPVVGLDEARRVWWFDLAAEVGDVRAERRRVGRVRGSPDLLQQDVVAEQSSAMLQQGA